jgi:hypothetical protein
MCPTYARLSGPDRTHGDGLYLIISKFERELARLINLVIALDQFMDAGECRHVR